MSLTISSKNQNTHFRSFPVYTDCCGGKPTTVTTKCNAINLICCLFCSNCWFLHQAFKTNDINCYDATHVCSACGKTKGNYSAC